MKKLLCPLFCLFTFTTLAQTQNVRGKVLDSETNVPLAGTKVEIDVSNDAGTKYRAVTDNEGAFSIASVPVGKYSLTTRYTQYEAKTQTIEVNSGKELILNILLQESVTNKEEVVVTGRKKGEIINE